MESRRGRCETQVLSDVAAIDQRITIAPVGIAPRIAMKQVGEENRRSRALDRLRLLEPPCHLLQELA